MTLGEKLKQARKEAGLTLAQAGMRSGHPESSIARWERGSFEPKYRTMCKLARLYGKPLEWFCPDERDAA